MEDVFTRLAHHLDSLPIPFPPSDSGVELKILRQWFTSQEAEIATVLTLMPEPVAAIAERLELDTDKLASILNDMSKKGIIFRIVTKNGRKLYAVAQFVPGMFEFHVNDLDLELIKDADEYLETWMGKGWFANKTTPSRVVPISESIPVGMNVMPYESAREVIQQQARIGVTECICRKMNKIRGNACEHPLEVCLMFGVGADYYVENAIGRYVTHEEALEILKTGEEAGLVLQPYNAQNPTNICMCCSCACSVMKTLYKMDKPAEVIHSNFYVRIDEDDCTSCGLCLERCQMNAITLDDIARVNRNRCIGCGACVVACEFGAIRLCQKDESERYVPPATVIDTNVCMMKERGKL